MKDTLITPEQMAKILKFLNKGIELRANALETIEPDTPQIEEHEPLTHDIYGDECD